MKLYSFDGIGDDLSLIPLAARRSLDAAGAKLSLSAWKGMTSEQRRCVAELGSGDRVDTDAVVRALMGASPPPVPIGPEGDPDPLCVPGELRAVFSATLLPDAVWSALAPLDRYALAKVAKRGKTDRIQSAFAEIVGHSAISTHLGPQGGARMVRIASKPVSHRAARARSQVTMSQAAFARLAANDVPKGDVLGTARLAAIMAAKRTPDLIPLCHAIALTHIDVELALDEQTQTVHIHTEVSALDRTGVEMEALVAASTAALVVYDMLKGIDRAMVIGPTALLSKTGGRSGAFERPALK